MFDWVLNMPLFLDGYYLHGLVSMNILLSQNVSNMYFQDNNEVQDCSFREFLSFKFKIVFFFLDPK